MSTQAGKESLGSSSYKDQYESILSIIGYNDSFKSLCPIAVKLVSRHSFIRHESATQTVLLDSTEDTEAASYSDAYILFTVDGNDIKISIDTSFTACTVTKMSFKSSSVSVKQTIG